MPPATMGEVAGRPTVLRWTVSLLALAGLVLGIPAALVAFHLTLPLTQVGHLVTSPSTAVHYLDRPVTDSDVVNSVACAAWIVWFWLLVCVSIETVAAIEGRPTLHLPASRHIQTFVSSLVGASLAIVPLSRDGLPMRLYVAPTAVHATVGRGLVANRAVHENGKRDPAEVFSTGGQPRDLLVAVDNGVPETASGAGYVVKSGDTLWSIAEHELGSPLRWQEIADLNYGRAQPGGDRFTNAHWIYPGWVLTLPSATTVSSPATVLERVPIPAADFPRGIANVQVGPLSRISHVLTRVDDEESDHEVATIPENLKHSGSQLTDSSLRGRHATSSVPLGMIVYGILGAGVIALLERMRRVQRRYRRNGLRIALPDDDLVALERRLRADSDPEGADIIDFGLRALVVYSLRRAMAPPLAALVRLGDQALQITLDPDWISYEPPRPFTSDLSKTSWFLSRDPATIQELREDSEIAQMDAPFPAMVTIGRDELGLALIDLEQAASIDVTGSNAEGIVGTIAIEMATSRWADQVELILVGFDQTLSALERVNHVSEIADVLPKVQRRVRERSALLKSVGRDANWEIRWAEGGDSWDLCVVICAQSAVEADRDGAAALIRIADNGGLGLAVVLGADASAARWHIEAGEGRVALRTNDESTSAFSSQSVDSQFSVGVASLVEVAGQLDGVLPSDPPYDKLQERGADGEPRGLGPHGVDFSGLRGAILTEPPPSPASDPEVEVRVLGPIEIVGASRPFTRAWAVELIVYLAMHRSGASSEQWATALWPDRVMAAASLHSTASAARRSLGVSISGDDHLPRAHGRLTLGPSVGSDWRKFADLSERADPESWARALELIRGRPFEGLRAPDWVLLEGVSANIEAVVVDLASRHAEHCLSAGDPSGAEWAARQGLRVSAYDERLYRILLRAADVAGNPAGVESVMAELVRLVAEDVEPYDAVHPETLDLYRTLSRRPTSFINR